MKLHFLPEAENALFEIALWVESKNTPGSGYRFVEKMVDKLHLLQFQKLNMQYVIQKF